MRCDRQLHNWEQVAILATTDATYAQPVEALKPSRAVAIAFCAEHFDRFKLLGRDPNDRLEIEATDNGVRHVCFGEIGAAYRCAREVGSTQIGIGEICPGEICPNELGLMHVAAYKLGACQVGNAEVSELQLEQRVIDTFKIAELALQNHDALNVELGLRSNRGGRGLDDGGRWRLGRRNRCVWNGVGGGFQCAARRGNSRRGVTHCTSRKRKRKNADKQSASH